MTIRTCCLLPTLLLSAVLPSQYPGEGPVLTRPLAEVPGMRPQTFGLVSFEGMASRLEPGGSRYFVISGRQTWTTPWRAKAWRLSASNTWSPLTDLDAITLDGDQGASLSPDLLALTVFRSGVGIELLTRTSPSTPFHTRRSIAGLFPLSYSPSFAVFDGVQSLITCTSSQPPSVAIHDFDIATAIGSRGRRLPHRLLGPTNHWIFATPVDDLTGHAKGLFIGEGANATFMDRIGYLGLTDTVRWFLDSPRGKRFLDPMQIEGGTWYVPCIGAPSDTVLRADMLLAYAQELPRTPGARVSVLAPSVTNPFDVTLLFGSRGQQGLSIPSITGKLALHPSPILALPFQRASNGVVTWNLNLSQAPRDITVDVQPFAIDPVYGAFLGADSWVHTY